MQKAKIYFFVGLTLIGLSSVLYLDFNDKKFNLHDIVVEYHGLVFDLLVLGLLFTIYEAIKSRQDKISRYREELGDYAGWESDEAKYRNRGIIKRLITLNANTIDLSGCSVKNCPSTKKMLNWRFINAKLYNSYFIHCDLSKSNFYLSELYNSCFSNVDLTDCDFGIAILHDCTFRNCIFNRTDFDFAYVDKKNWLDELQQNNTISEILNEKYILSTNSIIMNSKEYYQIIDKVHNKTTAMNRDDLNRDIILNYRPKFKFEL